MRDGGGGVLKSRPSPAGEASAGSTSPFTPAPRGAWAAALMGMPPGVKVVTR